MITPTIARAERSSIDSSGGHMRVPWACPLFGTPLACPQVEQFHSSGNGAHHGNENGNETSQSCRSAMAIIIIRACAKRGKRDPPAEDLEEHIVMPSSKAISTEYRKLVFSSVFGTI